MIKSFRWVLSTIVQYILYFYEYCQQLLQKYFTGKVITFDTGQRVIVGKQIAEGGFSYIFLAYDASSSGGGSGGGGSSSGGSRGNTHQRRTNIRKQQQPQQRQRQYALKRIHCPDTELIDRCRYEAEVHRDVMRTNHSHVMPLYGFTILQHDTCYMLFPLCTESLRDMINRTNPYLQPQSSSTTTHRHNNNNNNNNNTNSLQPQLPPISEVMVLQLFRQICHGVQALHTCGYTHRDMKIENVMIVSSSSSTTSRQYNNKTTTTTTSSSSLPHLLIMDFGSAGPTTITIQNRKQILEIVELASQHTTMPYRPPELFDGGIRLNTSNTNTNTNSSTAVPTTTTVLDYCAVDVWSLGCTLHAIMYGASPFECEFNTVVTAPASTSPYTNTMGNIKIVDCTHLSILGNIPVPKYVPISTWYSDSIRNELLLPMLRQEPHERPKLDTIIEMIDRMIVQLGGQITDMPSIANQNSRKDITYDTEHRPYRDNVDVNDNDTDGIALLSRMA